ncbi:MAG: DUF167 domain-containing protein [Phycisphaeraceae bacterium]|nr:DUF167 domain-containing protein [Phycisphaeraceae bacterium]
MSPPEVSQEIGRVVSLIQGRVCLQLKVVPGASRTKITGLLGDRLKVTVAAPPEDGKANKVICQLLAKKFSVTNRDVTVVRGTANPFKTVQLSGLTYEQAVVILQSILL